MEQSLKDYGKKRMISMWYITSLCFKLVSESCCCSQDGIALTCRIRPGSHYSACSVGVSNPILNTLSPVAAHNLCAYTEHLQDPRALIDRPRNFQHCPACSYVALCPSPVEITAHATN